LLIVFVAARSILCAEQQFKATRRVFLSLNVPRFVAIARPPCVRAFQKHCLVDYDVVRIFSLPSSRGHAGRYSPAGATLRFAACKRSRSAYDKSTSADASASRVDTAFSVSPGAIGPDTIDACTDALTANKRWWNTIASN
jgi:hypothetical protein